jgi:monoamine oxidase
MLQPVGGMDRVARAFESRVSNAIVYGAAVTEIRKTAAGARVVYNDRSGAPFVIEADYCVVTIPAPVLAGIANDFSAAHQAEISGFQYSSSVRVAFQSPRFWEREHNIYGGITWSDQEITQIWYPSHGFQHANGIVIGAYIFDGPAGIRFGDMDPATRVDTVRRQASGVHPEFQEQAIHGISVAWQKMEWQQGGWGTSTPSVLLAADDNIVFAGEHLSILQGWQEGAIHSAYSAIDQIVSRDLGA